LYFFLVSGEKEQQDSNSLIDYFKGQFSILNDVSLSFVFPDKNMWLLHQDFVPILEINMISRDMGENINNVSDSCIYGCNS
jgi:hypothetical protein